MKVVYFGPRREPAVLVERFDDLREGMIVWVVGCLFCGRRHRSIVAGPPQASNVSAPGHDPKPAVVREVVPRSPCLPPRYRRTVVSNVNVAERRVYRVVDAKLDADTTGERTAMEMERTR